MAVDVDRIGDGGDQGLGMGGEGPTSFTIASPTGEGMTTARSFTRRRRCALVDLFRIVHGEQRFAYVGPVRPGDVLSATLTVASLRQIGGNDIIGTRSEVTDAAGDLVCTTTATLVHRGPDEGSGG